MGIKKILRSRSFSVSYFGPRALLIGWILGATLGTTTNAALAEPPATERAQVLWAELAELINALPEDQRRAFVRELQRSLDLLSEPRPPGIEATVLPFSESTEGSTTPSSKSATASSASSESTEVRPTARQKANLEALPSSPERETGEVGKTDLAMTPRSFAGPEPAEPRAFEDGVEPSEAAEAQTSGRRRSCRALEAFDSDGDRKLTGLDRFWRHFYLWLDRDGDRRLTDNELLPPYEKGVRQIPLHLRSFVRGKKKRAREFPILNEQYLLLDLDNDGWSGPFPTSKDGALAVDFDAVKAAGGPSFLDDQGRPVTGVGAFRPGWSQVLEGVSEALGCPRP